MKLENKTGKSIFKWLVVINCFKVRISTQLLFDFILGPTVLQSFTVWKQALSIKKKGSFKLFVTSAHGSHWAGFSFVGLYFGVPTVNEIYKKVHECPTIRLNSLCNGFVSGLAPVMQSVILPSVYLLGAHL